MEVGDHNDLVALISSVRSIPSCIVSVSTIAIIRRSQVLLWRQLKGYSRLLGYSTRSRAAMASTKPPVYSKLQETFDNRPAGQHIGGWDELWKQSVTPWDRAGPSQALKDAVTSNKNAIGVRNQATGQRARALVPGCGRGYDVLSLASLGFDTYGVDGSESAIEAAEKLRQESGDTDTYRVVNEQTGRGKAEFIVGDFFKDGFLAATGGGDFDLIFDYTFLCALPQELRPAWAKRMSELLAPGGHLICLEWPLHKAPKNGGPPHGLSAELYTELLRRPGQDVEYDADGVVVPAKSIESTANALVPVERYRPERTHEAGKDSDFVSIWQHAQSTSSSL